MSSAVPGAARNRLTLRSPLARAVADVVQVARHQVAVGVRRKLFEPRTDPARVLAGLAQARGLDRQDRLRAEQVLGVDQAQRERGVVAGLRADRPVPVADSVAGLLPVVEDRDRKSPRLNSSYYCASRIPSSD